VLSGFRIADFGEDGGDRVVVSGGVQEGVGGGGCEGGLFDDCSGVYYEGVVFRWFVVVGVVVGVVAHGDFAAAACGVCLDRLRRVIGRSRKGHGGCVCVVMAMLFWGLLR